MATTTVNGIKLEYDIETDKAGKKGAVITRARGAKGDFVIPTEIKGVPVTSIGAGAFKGCEGLTGVTIPDSVMSIGGASWNGAFQGCKDLKDVAVPDSVTSIGDYAFRDCNALTSVKIGNGVTSIGECAFWCCPNLMSITIPNSVTRIGSSAFVGCSGLTSVTIPDSVTSIGSSAFAGCSGLTSITIPNSVTDIGDHAFEDCSGLTSVTIPDSVTDIGDGAFSGCSGLTSVTIPNSVTDIGDHAFENCSGLTSVTIPDGVESIGFEAFKDCSGLTSVTIGKGATSIGDGAFKGCCGLADGEGFIIVGNGLYDYVGKLKRVTIPDGVTCIVGCAFDGCSSFDSVTIPDSVTHIGANAFCDCSESLFDAKTVSGVVLVDGWAVDHRQWLSGDLNLTGIRGIGDGAFCRCENLKSVTLPKRLEGRLPEDAFAFCSDDLKITYCDEAVPAKKQVTSKSAPAGKVTFEELALRVIDYINSNGNYSATCKDGEISIKIGADRLYWFDAYCFLAAEEVPDGNGGDRPTLNVLRLIRRWDHKWDRVGRAQRNFVKKCEKLLRVEGTTPEELALALDAVGIAPAENVGPRVAAAKNPPKNAATAKKPLTKKPASKKAVKKTSKKK